MKQKPNVSNSSSLIEAPLCQAFDPKPHKPAIKLPPLACDTHAHVFGPEELYPYSSKRIYTPPDSLLSDYRNLLLTLGVERAVLVQPSVYGTDNSAMLDTIKRAGPHFRGVAVVSEDVSESELKQMHEAGVRGVRVNIVDVKNRKAGTLPIKMLEQLAFKIAPLGWHMELLLHVDEFPDLDKMLSEFPVDTVYGHFGYMKTEKGEENPGFLALIRLLKTGKAWVKLTGPYRISSQPLVYADTKPFARALINTAPERVLWGTDCPHVMVKGTMPNDGNLCDLLSDWIPDEGLLQKVLVDNPAQLYDFG